MWPSTGQHRCLTGLSCLSREKISRCRLLWSAMWPGGQSHAASSPALPRRYNGYKVSARASQWLPHFEDWRSGVRPPPPPARGWGRSASICGGPGASQSSQAHGLGFKRAWRVHGRHAEKRPCRNLARTPCCRQESESVLSDAGSEVDVSRGAWPSRDGAAGGTRLHTTVTPEGRHHCSPTPRDTLTSSHRLQGRV